MLWVLLCLILLLGGHGYLVGLVALILALAIFITGLGITLETPQYLVLTLLALSFPMGGYLAGLLLDKFSLGRGSAGIFSLLALALAAYLMLQTATLGDAFWVLGLIAQAENVRVLLPFAISWIGTIIFCGALSALVLMLLQVTVELPLHWLQAAARSRVDFVFPAWRPLLVLTGLAAAGQLLAGLYLAEMGPAAMLTAGQEVGLN